MPILSHSALARLVVPGAFLSGLLGCLPVDKLWQTTAKNEGSGLPIAANLIPPGHPSNERLEECVSQQISRSAPSAHAGLTAKEVDELYGVDHSQPMGSMSLEQRFANPFFHYVQSKDNTLTFKLRFPGKWGAPELLKDDKMALYHPWAKCIDDSSSRIMPLESLLAAFPKTLQALGVSIEKDEAGVTTHVTLPTPAALAQGVQALNKVLRQPIESNFVESGLHTDKESVESFLELHIRGDIPIAQMGYLYFHDATAHLNLALWPARYQLTLRKMVATMSAYTVHADQLLTARMVQNEAFSSLMSSTPSLRESFATMLDFSTANTRYSMGLLGSPQNQDPNKNLLRSIGGTFLVRLGEIFLHNNTAWLSPEFHDAQESREFSLEQFTWGQTKFSFHHNFFEPSLEPRAFRFGVNSVKGAVNRANNFAVSELRDLFLKKHTGSVSLKSMVYATRIFSQVEAREVKDNSDFLETLDHAEREFLQHSANTPLMGRSSGPTLQMAFTEWSDLISQPSLTVGRDLLQRRNQLEAAAEKVLKRVNRNN